MSLAGPEYPRISVRVGLVGWFDRDYFGQIVIFDVLTSLAIIYFSLEKELERNNGGIKHAYFFCNIVETHRMGHKIIFSLVSNVQ